MTSRPSGIELRHHNVITAARLIGEIADVYADARAEPPYDSDPRWQRPAFVSRFSQQANDPEIALVAAYADTEMVGFAYGRPIAPGRWFEGDTAPPDDILAATKFAVVELNVCQSWRRRGIGRALLDELLRDRPEQYAMLSTLPGLKAHQMYERMGWRHVATTLPDSGLPPWCTLILPLRN
ncbi:GNAT family N-acetyltransferase [Phytohabitans rumicis]|uniref:N-acetyltransferase domain-containing protein n=1 Tax=Phytohabitans rumicis TaxID=1076125 RepID=A0A6V8L4G9_9ACTN|nr:GNAT family N-acetyltransferase [Phytohabitans rumicis]GFJ87555.1 hypothetical protein Prum_011970 [Phytohabitans rumicis]